MINFVSKRFPNQSYPNFRSFTFLHDDGERWFLLFFSINFTIKFEQKFFIFRSIFRSSLGKIFYIFRVFNMNASHILYFHYFVLNFWSKVENSAYLVNKACTNVCVCILLSSRSIQWRNNSNLVSHSRTYFTFSN